MFGFDCVAMPYRPGVGGHGRQRVRCVSQKFAVSLRVGDASGGPGAEVLEFDAEDGALKTFHAVVVTDFIVMIRLAGGMAAQRASARGNRVVVGDERAALAVRAEIFCGIEAEASGPAELAHKKSR